MSRELQHSGAEIADESLILKVVTVCSTIVSFTVDSVHISMSSSGVPFSVEISVISKIRESPYANAKASGHQWVGTFTGDPEKSQGILGCQPFGAQVDDRSRELP